MNEESRPEGGHPAADTESSPLPAPIINETNPNSGPVAHVYVDVNGGGLCVCGRERFTALHVHECGDPLPDLEGLRELCATIKRAADAILDVLDGGLIR